MKLDIERISSRYAVRRLTEADIPEIYALCKENRTYYHYMKQEPTPENIREVLTVLPPNQILENKYFLGFYREDRLTAILDLIAAYPNEQTAFIGWFMLDRSIQGSGIGSEILSELLAYLHEGFQFVRLGYVKGNRQSEGFWLKNGFLPTGAEAKTDSNTVVLMQKAL